MLASSNGLVNVGVSMVLQDKFTSEAGRISSSFKSMMSEMSNYGRSIDMTIGSTFEGAKNAVSSMYDAFKYSAQVSKDVFLTAKMAGATHKEQKELLDLAQEINARNPLRAADITSGEKFLAMAGNSTEQIKNMIEPAAQLAAIFSMPLGGKGGVADLMTNIMSTFGIDSSQASKVADVLGIATTSANVNLTDMAMAFQMSGAELRNAKVPLTDAAAAIGILGNQGIQGTKAGTALANMYRYLTLSITGGNKKGTNALKAIGLDPKSLIDANGNIKSLGYIINAIHEKLGDNPSTIKSTPFMHSVFGVRGQRSIAALLLDNNSKFQEILAKYQMSSNQNWTANTNKQYMEETAQGAIDAYESALENLKVEFGKAFTPIFKPVVVALGVITKMITSLTSSGLGGFIARYGMLATIGFTVVRGVQLIRGTWRMINALAAVQNVELTTEQGKLTGINAMYASMEAHLRTMVALQMQLTGLQMAPGSRINLPMGGTLGKSKRGTVSVGVQGAFGGGSHITTPSNYVNTMAGAAAGAAAGQAATRAVTQGAAATTGAIISTGARTAGFFSKLLGFFGGGWGAAITFGVPLIIDLLSTFMGKEENNNQEEAKREKDLQEMQQIMQQNMVNQLEGAVERGTRAGLDGGISINYTPGLNDGGGNGGAPGLEQDLLDNWN
nr:MAG TPA: minor tail protein [Caudoviricetes sp.]